VIGPGRRLRAFGFGADPLARLRVQFMQVIQVILSVPASENIDLFVVTIGRVHVARSRRDSLRVEIKPHIILKV
jgi:hypothetical protein